ncbi:hypothetical protein LV89_00519 [Arcicella aurantiaca]|uniref:Uncharacterized protein n=1 Tax=Arcicella aurantiaca TaxID=591202 RepID=A0A316F076_9BACT|nr:hypothetical protein [Arcicella aurantiaca]PWK28966.1 hypothetical protein LV89_00519 [Arcicella aurantiaca]
MNNPITIFPDEEMAEKFKQKRESLGMTEEEYFAHLMELSDEDEYAEIEDEEPDEEDEETEIEDEETEIEDEEFDEELTGITDISDNDSIIKELKLQVKAREDELIHVNEELNGIINYPRINLLFDLVRGHTLKINNTDIEMVIRTKKDFIQCLVKNFHANIDSEDFGIDSDEFEEMENEAFKDYEEEDENDDEDDE